MESLKILKIKIYQPQAHYRIPFTYQRRHTYPIPPYSTIIGFLCNVLGIRNYKNEGEPCEHQNCDCNYHKLKQIKISICGYFESKTTEFIWFRNLNKEAHIDRFRNLENRYLNGEIEHIGGQSPVYIDILNDVHLWIYIFHSNFNFLESVKKSLENPSNWIYPLHLGRAEDWVVIKNLEIINVKKEKEVICGNYNKFFWIPKSYSKEKPLGLVYKIPTFYKIKNGYRVFNYEDVYLSEGEFTGEIKAYVDKNESELPIFLKEDENEHFS
jgi:CRISPR-associated protein Cas5t